MRKSLAVALAAILLVGCSYTPPPPRGPGRSRARASDGDRALARAAEKLPKMRAHFINVGQGSALLLEFPCAAALIDTGGEVNAQYNANKVLKAYLTRFFANRPDLKHELKLLVVTHPHLDHVLGLDSILLSPTSRIKIANVVTNGQDDEDLSGGPQMSRLHRWAAARKEVRLRKVRLVDIPHRFGRTGPIIDPIQCPQVDPKIRVLWSSPRKKPKEWDQRTFLNANEHSLVLRVDFGKASFLLLADLEHHGINSMIQHARNPKLFDVDVLQVGHHGSWNGTTKNIVAYATPKMAVIQCGSAKRELDWTAYAYGHPRLSAVQMLTDGISGRRRFKSVPVATRVRTFHNTDMDKALYATGWDGHVILEAATNGYVRRVAAE